MQSDKKDSYKWIALSNTTLGMFMAALDSSIVSVVVAAPVVDSLGTWKLTVA